MLLLLLFSLLLANAKLEGAAALSFSDATQVVEFIYDWFLPDEQFESRNRVPIIWTEHDAISRCQQIENYGKGKKYDETSIAKLNSRIEKMIDKNAKSYLKDLIEKSKRIMPELIENKWSSKKNSLYGFFREAFVVAKILVHSLIDQYSKCEENGACGGIHLNGTQRDLAIHKYQQAELFFIKCSLKISFAFNKIHTMQDIFPYMPNFRAAISRKRIHVPINIIWEGENEDIAKVWTTELFTLNDGISVVEFVNYFIQKLCHQSGTFFGKDINHFPPLLNCIEAKQLKEFSRKEINNFGMEGIARELVEYEFGRMEQRLVELGEHLDISEKRMVQTFAAGLAKYGMTIFEDLLGNLDEFNLELLKKTESKIILNKYAYEEMLKRMTKDYSALKRHIKYLEASVRLAPNGEYLVEEYKAPKMRAIIKMNKNEIQKLKTINLTPNVAIIIQLIKYGNEFVKNNSLENFLNSLSKLKEIANEELKISENFEKNFYSDFGVILGKSLHEDNDMIHKMKLTAIYGNAIAMAEKHEDKHFRSGLVKELEAIIGWINGIDEIEERLADSLLEGETCQKYRNGGMLAKEVGKAEVGCKMMDERTIYGNIVEIFGKIGEKYVKSRENWKANFNMAAKVIILKIEKLKQLKTYIEKILMVKLGSEQKLELDEKIIMDEEEELILHNSKLKELRKIAAEEIQKLREDMKAKGKEQYNIIEVGTFDGPPAIINLQNLKLATYDVDGNPSFSESKKIPRLRAPGEFRIVSGKLIMREKLPDYERMIIKLTAKLCIGPICGTICDHGQIGINNENSTRFGSFLKSVKNPIEAILATIIPMAGGQNICTFESSEKYLKDFHFHLGTVHFVENLFKNVLKEMLENNYKKYELKKLFADSHYFYTWDLRRTQLIYRVFLSGLLEPEGGFFELMAFFSKHMTGLSRKAANAGWIFGIEIFDEKDKKMMLSMKIPAKDYVDMKM